jgi:hypothetical protein
MSEDQTNLAENDDDGWQAWQRHMERCMAAVVAPCRTPGIEVTIVVRAPGATAALAQVSTNGDLCVARDAIANILAERERVS